MWASSFAENRKQKGWKTAYSRAHNAPTHFNSNTTLQMPDKQHARAFVVSVKDKCHIYAILGVSFSMYKGSRVKSCSGGPLHIQTIVNQSERLSEFHLSTGLFIYSVYILPYSIRTVNKMLLRAAKIRIFLILPGWEEAGMERGRVQWRCWKPPLEVSSLAPWINARDKRRF